ncbi:MAG: GerMN domain-containing protein [Firmicutes bacterium]|nr:GerMN domain-containing protein [Bacillota bacterium]
MFKKTLLILLVFTFLLTGCQTYDNFDKGNSNYPPIEPYPTKYDSNIKLYYPDEYSEMLTWEVRDIKEQNRNFEEILILELLKGSQKDNSNVIPEDTELLSIDVIARTAYVNFSKGILDNNKSEINEAFVLYSIVNTLTQLDKITNVQIFIEGERRDVLYDNYDINQPIDRSGFIINKKYVSPIITIKKYNDFLINNDYFSAVNLHYENKGLGISNRLLKSELKQFYTDVKRITILDYAIDRYDFKIKVRVKSKILYKNNEQYDRVSIYELVYDNGEYKIYDFYKEY